MIGVNVKKIHFYFYTFVVIFLTRLKIKDIWIKDMYEMRF
jgi:hypothetical protein